jgi:hypothetical protein
MIFCYVGGRDMCHFNYASDETRSNVLSFAPLASTEFVKNSKNNIVNSCEKPTTLLRWLIVHHSKIGETILDLFSGTGSTAVAALEEGCNSVSIELDKKQIPTITSRLTALPPDDLDDMEIEDSIPSSPISVEANITQKVVCCLCKTEGDDDDILLLCHLCQKTFHADCVKNLSQFSTIQQELLISQLESILCSEECYKKKYNKSEKIN